MRKKVIISLGAVAVAAFVCCLLFFYKGNDEMTFFQRQTVNQYLAASPFEQDASGNNIVMPISVASGTDGYDCGEFLGARNQIDYLSGCIEVKVVVTENGEVVLAESYGSVKDTPATLNRVIEQLGSDGRLVLNLSEYSRLYDVNSVLVNNRYLSKSVITGVNENAVKYVKSFFPKTKVLCDWGKDNERSLEAIAQDGADGILCSKDAFSEKLLKKAQETGLIVWVNCEDDIYTTVKAMKFGASGVITSRPDFALTIGRDWYEEALKGYFEQQ